MRRAQRGVHAAKNDFGMWRLLAQIGDDFFNPEIPVGHSSLYKGIVEWGLIG